MTARRTSRQLASKETGRAVEVPADAPAWVSAELIELTIRTWQPYYASTLTPQEAVYIIMSVGRLFDVLSRGDVA